MISFIFSSTIAMGACVVHVFLLQSEVFVSNAAMHYNHLYIHYTYTVCAYKQLPCL